MISGKVFKYGDNINTDVIIPARYLNTCDSAVLAKHCMEDIDADFTGQVAKGDIIVAGDNFGCGSSREHAPLAIKASKVSVVIAKSFARIFYRNAINIGLLLIENAEIVDNTDRFDILSVDFEKCLLINETKHTTYSLPQAPSFVYEIQSCGGLIEAIKKGVL